MIRTTHPLRRGFTLVEMLVAMALAIVVLGLAIGISQTGAFDSYKTVGAADKLSQWMLVAKSRALRDKAPRGIRLIPDSTNPEFIREIAYIEQPDPIPSNGPLLIGSRLIFYYPCQVVDNASGTPATTYNYDSPFPTALAGAPASPATKSLFLAGLTVAQLTELNATLQSGDLISVPELRAVMRINGTPALSAAAASSPGFQAAPATTVQLNVTLESLPDLGSSVFSYHSSSTRTTGATTAFHPLIPTAPNNGTLTVTSFSIIRAPRPLLGEPTQQLPTGMAVDVRGAATTSLNPPAADVNGNRDILFAPSGEVIGSTDAITALLLRDVNLPNVATINPLASAADYNLAGQLILICLYNKTGAVATQPVNPPPAVLPPGFDAYRFARDGINTGL